MKFHHSLIPTNMLIEQTGPQRMQFPWQHMWRCVTWSNAIHRLQLHLQYHYRNEIQRLSGWCCINNLEFNTTKTKEYCILYWISGENTGAIQHRFGLMEQVWSRLTHSSIWHCTYQITSPGPSTPKKSGKRHNSVSISSGCRGGTTRWRRCLRPSTAQFITSQFGIQAAQLQIRNLFSGSFVLLRKSSAAHLTLPLFLPLGHHCTKLSITS